MNITKYLNGSYEIIDKKIIFTNITKIDQIELLPKNGFVIYSDYVNFYNNKLIIYIQPSKINIELKSNYIAIKNDSTILNELYQDINKIDLTITNTNISFDTTVLIDATDLIKDDFVRLFFYPNGIVETGDIYIMNINKIGYYLEDLTSVNEKMIFVTDYIKNEYQQNTKKIYSYYINQPFKYISIGNFTILGILYNYIQSNINIIDIIANTSYSIIDTTSFVTDLNIINYIYYLTLTNIQDTTTDAIINIVHYIDYYTITNIQDNTAEAIIKQLEYIY